MTSSPLGKVLHLHAQDDDNPPMRTLTSRSCFLPQPINVVVVIRQTRTGRQRATTTSHCASTSTHHHRIGSQIQPWRSRTDLSLPSSIISLFRGPQHSSNSITSTVGVDKASNKNRRRKERKGSSCIIIIIIIITYLLLLVLRLQHYKKEQNKSVTNDGRKQRPYKPSVRLPCLFAHS
jgi:hypothetical protein